jgi:hypothetical protein
VFGITVIDQHSAENGNSFRFTAAINIPNHGRKLVLKFISNYYEFFDIQLKFQLALLFNTIGENCA